MDIDAYFRRIGYSGSREPSLATLHALSAAHVLSIPFENLDVLLGLGINLDPEAVDQKILHCGRGGYCFEQNTLFLRALLTLGFDAHPLGARVRIGHPRDFTPPRTHMFLRVELEGASWLVDAGIGALSLTERCVSTRKTSRRRRTSRVASCMKTVATSIRPALRMAGTTFVNSQSRRCHRSIGRSRIGSPARIHSRISKAVSWSRARQVTRASRFSIAS